MSTPTILYIDTNPHEREKFLRWLQPFYKILTSGTLAEAWQLLRENEVAMVIVEEKMPEQSGHSFLQSLVSFEGIKILIGEKAEKNTFLRAFNSQLVQFCLVKPLQKNEVNQTIADGFKLLRRHQREQQRLQDWQLKCAEMKFLHEVSQKISETKPLPRLLNEIMESSKRVMKAEASSLLLYDPEECRLHFHVATGEKGKMIRKFSLNLGEGIAGWVALHKKPLLIQDCYNDPRFNPEFDRKVNFKTRSMICVPLIRKRRLLGVMEVLNKKPGGVFQESDLTIFETLASQCAIAIENAHLVRARVATEALERELETAREIQQTLLPASLPAFSDLQVAARLIPAKMVGGDYYNIIRINNHQSLFLIADVSGKGIPAALIVSTIYSCLFTYLNMNRHSIELTHLVDAMNKVLLEATPMDKYATAWFGLYDHKTGQLCSVNAGHNSPLLFRKGMAEPKRLETGGIFLGSLDVTFQQEIVQLHPSDTLVFYTDGVTEAWNQKKEEYQEDRLIQAVNQAREQTAYEILRNIEQDVRDHVGKAQQSDDFTCVVVKVEKNMGFSP